MANIVWKQISSGENLSKDEVIETLRHRDNGIVVLSGSSNAGKTTLLSHLRCRTNTPMMIYSYQDAVDSIVTQAKAHRWDEGIPFFVNHPAGAILAIEDIDFLRGKEVTRHTLYEQVNQLSKQSLIILTGIALEERMGDMFQCLPEADWFYAIDLCNQPEFWHLFDKNGAKLSGVFHIRGKAIPQGTYHQVVHALVRDSHGQFLLGQRASNRKFPLLWEFPAGSVTIYDETPAQAAARETYEELGLLLDPDRARCIDVQVRDEKWGMPYRDILYVYLFDLEEILWNPEEAPTKEEVAASRLFTPAQIRALQEQNLLHPDLDYFFDLHL